MNAPVRRASPPGWSDLLSGGNLIRSLTLSGGVALHAINLYLSTTILPSVVREIGGLDYYAWNTTLFVVASILGASLSARLLRQAGPRVGYVTGATVFALGALACAVAPSMALLLAGRFVQGLGGGILLALPYAMIRRVFAESLWPRALALLSSMWGIATLLGPAIGGVFAELGIWRTAFWSLIPAAGLLAAAAILVLPKREPEPGENAPLPLVQLVLLTLAVLAASWASIGAGVLSTAAGLAMALALIGGLVVIERHSTRRLLPSGTFTSSSALGALYAASAMLAVTVTCTEIFLPLFLQDLHGRSPLEAGYIAAVMSAGWTAGAIFTSGLGNRQKLAALRIGPGLSLIAVAVLAFIIPWTGAQGDWVPLTIISVALLTGGVGVGLAYPHLSAFVLQAAPPDEADNAASSIMTVQLCATALGAALAGLTVNLAGAGTETGTMDTASAARWLFIVVAAAPLTCLLLLRNGLGQKVAALAAR